MLLPNLGRVGPKKARYITRYNDQFLLLVLLHDALLWNTWSDIEYVNKIYKLLDDFGYKDESLEFMSYRKQNVVTSPDKDIHISVYKLKHKSLAVIGNWQNKNRQITININLDKLGLKPELKLRELRSNKIFQGNPVQLDIQARNFLLLEISNEMIDR